jgi:hypothetical protein
MKTQQGRLWILCTLECGRPVRRAAWKDLPQKVKCSPVECPHHPRFSEKLLSRIWDVCHWYLEEHPALRPDHRADLEHRCADSNLRVFFETTQGERPMLTPRYWIA